LIQSRLIQSLLIQRYIDPVRIRFPAWLDVTASRTT